MPSPRRTICGLLILAMLLLDLPPAAAFDVGATANGSGDAAQVKGTTSIPSFPEPDTSSDFDWSSVDWDKPVILPADEEEYVRNVQLLTSQQRFGEIASLQKKEQPFSSDRVMEYYQVPDAVQVLVRAYRTEKKETPLDFFPALKEKLAYDIRKVLGRDDLIGNQSADPLDPLENNFLLKPAETSPSVPTLDPSGPLDSAAIPVEVELKKTLEAPLGENSLEDITSEALDELHLPKNKNSTSAVIKNTSARFFLRLKEAVGYLFGTQEAYAASSLIEWYDGIEKNPAEYALYSLAKQQNQDGSFGTENQYEMSMDIALLLTELGRTKNDQYNALISFLEKATPRNTREKIMKARLLLALGQPYQSLLDEVIALQNPDGGFGIDRGYTSDPLTTLEFIWCVWASQQDVQKRITGALYFVSSQIRDDGSLRFSQDGIPSYYLINKVAKDLKPFRDLVIVDGSKDEALVAISDKINSLLSYLKSKVDTDSGTLKGSTDITDQIMTLETFTHYGVHASEKASLRSAIIPSQLADGSFGHSLYATISAIRALRSANFTISNLEPVGELVNQKEFTIKVSIKNNGLGTAAPKRVVVFVDGVFLSSTELDPIQYRIPPQDTKISNFIFPKELADRIVGKSKFLFYVDEENDTDTADNWVEETFSVASSSDGSPAMPLYAIIYKYDLDGKPAINVRWAKREDSNRKNFDVLFRLPGQQEWKRMGIPFQQGWNGAFIGFPVGLDGQSVEGRTYEFTLGVLHANRDAMSYFTDPIAITLSADPKKDVGTAQANVTRDGTGVPAYAWGYGVSGTSGENGNLEFKNIQHGSTAAWVDVPYYEKLTTFFGVKANSTVDNIRIFTRIKSDTEAPQLDRTEILWPLKGPAVKNQYTYKVFASGVDNVYFNDVDFWYWDPANQQWIFLRSVQATPSSNQAYFDWDIPKELLGKDFKLKAIAHDYRGNASAPKEWGPFEILDGSAATASVRVEGLEQNVWYLGEKKSVSWEIKSPNPLLEISSVRLKTDNGTLFIKGNSPADLKSAEYTLAANAAFESDAAKIAVYYCDKAFTCGFAESEPFRIVDPSPLPPSPWGKERKSNLVSSKYPLERYVDAVLQDADGSLDIVYREFDSSSSSSDGNTFRRIVWRNLRGGEWGAPVVLVEHRYKPGETDDIYFNEVTAIKGPDGSIHVGFQRFVNGSFANLDLSTVFYLRVKNGALESREQVSSDVGAYKTAAMAPRIAVNAKGEVFYTWLQGYSYARGEGKTVLWIKERLNTPAPEVLRMTNDWTASPALAVDGDIPVVAYSESEQFFLQVKRDGQWWVPAPIVPRTILKKELDAVNNIGAVLDSIVKVSSNDPSLYEWLPAIKKKADLENILKAKAFEGQDAVLNLWRINQYAQGAYAPQLFVNGNSEYDLFFRKGGEKRSWKYDIAFLRFGLSDYKKGDGNVSVYRSMMDASSVDDARGYSVARNKDGIYHIAYSRMWWPPSGQSKSNIFYVLFDGVNLLHRAQIASPLRYVDDQKPLILERDDQLSVYFSDLGMINSANLSKMKQYRLTALKPVSGATTKGFPVELSWDVQGGNISSYSLLLGKSQEDLKEIASGLSTAKFTAENLDPDAEYFWQVVGKEGDVTVYGGPWRFTTGPYEPAITIENGSKKFLNGDTIQFGKNPLIGGESGFTLIIKNAGMGDLKFPGANPIRITGNEDRSYRLSFNSGKDILKKGEERSIGVYFSPQSVGQKKGTLIIESNDTQANPFTLELSGEGATPRMSITKDGKEIEDNNTFSVGEVSPGQTKEIAITVTNNGNYDLILPVRINGDKGFSIKGREVVLISPEGRELEARSVKPGESAQEIVTFTAPEELGDKTAKISWLSNDPQKKTFTVRVYAVVARPVLQVLTPGNPWVERPSGSEWGVVGIIGADETRKIQFGLKNSGNQELILSDFKLTGDGYSGGQIGDPFILIPGAVAYFPTITLKASKRLGVYEGTYSFKTNDPSVPRYTFSLKSVVWGIDMVLMHDGQEVASGSTIDIGSIPAGKTKEVTLPILNNGNNTNLKVSDFKLEGSAAFSIASSPQATDVIEAGTSRDVVVRFASPQAHGGYTANLSFASNDPNKKKVSIVLKAVTTKPELKITYKGQSIKTNDTLTLGELESGGTKDAAFTIENSGNSDLIISDVVLKGTDFTFVGQVPEKLSPNTSKTLTVRFVAGKQEGNISAALSFKTNDPTTPEERFVVAGTVIRPIAVITNDAKQITASDTYDFGNVLAGERKDAVFVITNNGSADLFVSNTAVLDSDAFRLLESPKEKIEKGKSSQVSVAFTAPLRKGNIRAKLAVTTNDPDTPEIVFTLQGASLRAELSIVSSGRSLNDIDEYDLGSLPSGQTKDILLTIGNGGNRDLELSNISLSGSNAFRIMAQPLGPLTPGSLTNLEVRFTAPLQKGEASSILTLTTNDPVRNNISLALKANSLRPEINMAFEGDIGDIASGSSKDIPITIRNSGNTDLKLSKFSLADDTSFSFKGAPLETIAPNKEGLLTIAFTAPGVQGVRTATLIFSTNDPAKGDIQIPLKATVRRAEISVMYDQKGIQNGDVTALGDFAPLATKDIIFSIKNTGNATLSLGKARIEGSQDFALFGEPQASIAPQESTSLKVRFESSYVKGVKDVKISFSTNDPARKEVNFAASASTVRSELVLTSDGQDLASNGTVSYGEFKPGETKDLTFSIANGGNRDLRLSYLTLIGSDSFATTTPVSAKIAQGESAALTIRFIAPQEKGEKTATLSFKTNDPERKTITLSLEALVKRSELAVSVGGKPVNFDNALSFGDVDWTKTKDLELMISNTGNEDLTLENLILEGEGFSLLTSIPKFIVPAETIPVFIRYTADVQKGEKNGIFSFRTNDPSHKNVKLAMQAVARRPEFTLFYDGKVLANNDVIDLGNMATGNTENKQLRITNTGNSDLTFDSVSIEGASDFAIPNPSIGPLAAGASIDLPFKLVGHVEGEKKASLKIKTNGPDSPFTLNMRLTVTVTEGTGTGLKGEYFSTRDFKALSVRRTDPKVDFDWNTKAPDPSMPVNNFSIRWSGKVEAQYTGLYTFIANTDDGSRLWVNGQKIIDQWNDHNAKEYTGAISLEAGKQYDITFEYYDGSGQASAQLAWETPYGRKEIIPASQLYPAELPDLIPSPRGTGKGLWGEYYADKKLTSRVLTRNDDRINFNWKAGSPDSSVPADRFSVRWSGFVEPQYTGVYTFSTNTDDGSRLWINGEKLVDRWNDHPVQENKGAIALEAGTKYAVVFEYYDQLSDAVAQLLWETPYGRKELIPTAQLYPASMPQVSKQGLKGEYYADANYLQHVFTRLDQTVDFKWGDGSPDPALKPNYFAARWRGKVTIPEGGQYRFTTLADDGVRLWVDGQLLINDWMYAHPPQWNSGALVLEGGKSYDIQLDYYEAYAGAQVQLFWNGPRTNGKEELIPANALTPAL